MKQKCFAQYQSVLSIARVAKTLEERQEVKDAITHAEECEDCLRFILKSGFRNIEHFKDFIFQEWRNYDRIVSAR